MPKKFTYEYVKEAIEKTGDTLVSLTYERNNKLMTMNCQLCGNDYEQTFARRQAGFGHRDCPTKPPSWNAGITTVKVEAVCPRCNCTFIKKTRKQYLCSLTCADQVFKEMVTNDANKVNSRKGGLISASRQTRRSKNEIHFAELCEATFENVLTNEPIFDGCDADVILPDLKIAILWNGIWHYQQVRKNHSVLQVQSRDKIKMKIIKRHGYACYIIKDMGKEKKDFVEKEFNYFLDYLVLADDIDDEV